jgi:hypothetical protein
MFLLFLILLAIILLVILTNWNYEKFQNQNMLECGININSVNVDCPKECKSLLTDTDLNNNVYLYCLNSQYKKIPYKDLNKPFYDENISGGISCPNASNKNWIVRQGQNSVYSICEKNND